MTMRLSAAAAAAFLALAATPAFALPGGSRALPPTFAKDSALQAAVKAPQRSPQFVARDGARHPAETLSFWGLRPGQTVLEMIPGGGYWTEILSPYAKSTGGRLLATTSDLEDPMTPEGAKKGSMAFAARFGDKATFGNVEPVVFGGKTTALARPGSIDLVITARNVHNWMMAPGQQLDRAMGMMFAALKPGGVLGVEDHRSDPRAMLPGVTDGYVSEASVIAAAEKAGFKFDGRSEINANPKDTKDYPFGVWTLPPTRRSAPMGKPSDPAFDHAKYDAIGESDRMTLRFRKPR